MQYKKSFTINAYKVPAKTINWRVEVRYTDRMNKSHRVTKQGFATKKAAISHGMTIADDKMKELEVYTDYVTLREVFESNIKQCITLNKAENTLRARYTAISFFKSIMDEPLTSIKKYQIKNILEEADIKINTKRTYLKTLTAVFNYAIDELEVLQFNPCKSIKIFEDVEEKIEDKKRKRTVLSPIEIQDLYNKLKTTHREEALVVLIQGTMGLRVNEALGIQYKNINGNQLTIEAQSNNRALKTANSYRTLTIPQYTLKEIQAFTKDFGVNFKGIFFGRTKKLRSIEVRINALLKKELGDGVTSHWLRHSYGSNLVASGVDLPTVARLMGDTLETISKTYIHATTEGIEYAEKISNEIFS